jgi:hypothetical protein
MKCHYDVALPTSYSLPRPEGRAGAAWEPPEPAIFFITPPPPPPADIVSLFLHSWNCQLRNSSLHGAEFLSKLELIRKFLVSTELENSLRRPQELLIFSILSHKKQTHNHRPSLLEMQFNVILPSSPTSPKCMPSPNPAMLASFGGYTVRSRVTPVLKGNLLSVVLWCIFLPISYCGPKREHPKILWNLAHNLTNMYGSHGCLSDMKVLR